MLPCFAGERTPIMDPDARGMIAGLTLSHTRGDLYRAALEAIELRRRLPGRLYAPDPDTADKALAAKAAMFAELGVVVHLCGDV